MHFFPRFLCLKINGVHYTREQDIKLFFGHMYHYIQDGKTKSKFIYD